MKKGTITEMYFDVVFDREVTREHYISPGSYTFVSNGKSYQFDFFASEGGIDKDNPKVVHYHVFDFDGEYSDNMDDFCADALEKIEEFFIYTGEYDDSELIPVRIKNLSIVQSGVITRVSRFLLNSIEF
jgi:hypothetical protein